MLGFVSYERLWQLAPSLILFSLDDIHIHGQCTAATPGVVSCPVRRRLGTSRGIHIGTLDNPGWSLDVSLADTPLAGKPFAELKVSYEHETEWLTCFIRDGKFKGRCGPEKLEEMIAVFVSWAEESQRDALHVATPVI